MECGEFQDRNREYYKNYSKELYFQRLLMSRHPNDTHSDQLAGKGRIIFDVGAHGGESAIFFNKIFPLANIFSFEPIPEMANLIRSRQIQNNTVVECALSDFNGKQNFYVQDISHLSSLHKVNKDSNESLGYHKKETHRVIEVAVKRGDSCVQQLNIDRIDLLKMDVQANEVKALEGFAHVIDKVNIVLVEVSFYDFYQNKSSIKLLEEKLPNFELYDIFEISKNPKTLGTDWATIVYKNQEINV